MTFSPSYNTDHVKAPVKGIVRATLHIGCWLLTPIGENQTKVDVMVELSLGGSIPQRVTNHMNNEQGMNIHKIRPVIAKYVKEMPRTEVFKVPIPGL